MRIPAWRAFLLGGLVAMAVYLLLPDTERIAAAGSAVFHFASAVAVLIGIRRYLLFLFAYVAVARRCSAWCGPAAAAATSRRCSTRWW
jgi:hypothetical protein